MSQRKITTKLREAEKETTRGKAYVQPKRKSKRSISLFIDPPLAQAFKVVAAAKGKGLQQYLEQMVRTTVKRNSHLIAEGELRLKEPKRYTTHAQDLEKENRSLKRLLRKVGCDPS